MTFFNLPKGENSAAQSIVDSHQRSQNKAILFFTEEMHESITYSFIPSFSLGHGPAK